MKALNFTTFLTKLNSSVVLPIFCIFIAIQCSFVSVILSFLNAHNKKSLVFCALLIYSFSNFVSLDSSFRIYRIWVINKENWNWKKNDFNFVHFIPPFTFQYPSSTIQLPPSSQYMFLIRKHISSNLIRTSHLLVMNPPCSL